MHWVGYEQPNQTPEPAAAVLRVYGSAWRYNAPGPRQRRASSGCGSAFRCSKIKAMRRKAIVGISLGIVLLPIYAFFAAHSQPCYQGRKLQRWLDVAHPTSSASPTQRRAAEEAVRHIGAEGLPWLIAWLKAEDSTTVRSFTKQFYGHLVPFGITRVWVPAVDHHLKAAYGFRLLGPKAEAAIPDLVGIVGNAPSVDRAMPGLRALCGIGSEKSFAAIMSLKSTRPLFSEQFLRDCFLSMNPDMAEYAKRKSESHNEDTKTEPGAANPQSRANRSQPFSSETDSTSAAAGSGQSP